MMKARTVSLTNILCQAFKPQKGALTFLKGLKNIASIKPEDTGSIGLYLEKQAAAIPDEIALRYDDITLTYSELNRRANQLSHLLLQNGVKSGDAIAINISNRPECLISVFAVVKTGAIAAMLNTSQKDDVLLHSINLVNPVMILTGEELTDNIETVASQLPPALRQNIYWVPASEKSACPAGYKNLAEDTASQPDNNPGTTASILTKQPCYYVFTSGTTGLPKASVMSHYRWLKAMAGIGMTSMRLRQSDTLYVCLPFYHNNALTVSLASVLGAGCSLAIGKKFSVSRFWDDIRHYNATAFCYIGELCRYLLNNPASADDRNHSVRVIVGNGLRPDIWMDFKQRFGIQQISEFYGASECNLIFTNLLNLDCTAGLCPLPYRIVRYDIEREEPLRNQKGHLIPVARGESGLLITEINPKQPFDGYTDESASRKKVLTNAFRPGDAWFNTGDLVIDQGFRHIAFADRLGDTFRWKGENVATTEVEAIANEFPGVEHAIAYGVEIPGTDGRAGMAALTVKDINSFDIASFSEHLTRKLPTYAVPLFFRLRSEEEITGTFKYRKVTLKEEGYSLEKVSDPLYLLPPQAQQHTAMTPEYEEQILQQSLRF